jgi:ubiquinone/menaquinone biosynthesis C-methylase UbiE
MNNIDDKTVDSFGKEWTKFNQLQLNQFEINSIFSDYFSIFPWCILNDSSEGFDMGCGTGRWAKMVAPRVGVLNCIDPSSAIYVAKENLKQFSNVRFFHCSSDDVPLNENSQDFGFSLGVLHHIPDTQQALNDCVKLLKSKAPFLLYLYYALENRNIIFRALWRISNIMRVLISASPSVLKNFITDLIAVFVYLPIASLCKLLSYFKINTDNMPLSYYKNLSFYTMRTDSRDRFGTPLEKRFTRDEIERMMMQAGLESIEFSDKRPFWCAIGKKK